MAIPTRVLQNIDMDQLDAACSEAVDHLARSFRPRSSRRCTRHDKAKVCYAIINGPTWADREAAVKAALAAGFGGHEIVEMVEKYHKHGVDGLSATRIPGRALGARARAQQGETA